MKLNEAIEKEMSWGSTENGCDTLVTTGSSLMDLFARGGSMRGAEPVEQKILFSSAYRENADFATKLLFYIRDIRGGYGERDTFRNMLRELANINVESVEKNLWAILEYGYAKDLYCLIGTPAEDAMWKFMKEQFELDLENCEAEKGISLLAKWIATPTSSSVKTKELGKLTAKKLGYNFKTMKEYKAKLIKLRKYLDLPEAKVCSGRFAEIEYSKCSSRFLLKYRGVISKKDKDRWQAFNTAVSNGEATINTETLNPCDIIYEIEKNKYSPDLETMWNNLKDVCDANVLVMADSSGSMTSGAGSIPPLVVAASLAMYFAQRNKGSLKDFFMTFSYKPEFVKLTASTLDKNYDIVYGAAWKMNTDLAAAFELLLNTAKLNNVPKEEMPDALLIVSDMQIDCVNGVSKSGEVTFFDLMNKRYEEAGYKLPHVVFWNVNAAKPTFLARRSDKGVSLVSGYSVNVFKQVMECFNTTPYELMLNILNSDRYAKIVA